MKDILTGKTQTHLIQDESSQLLVHKDMLPALQKLRADSIAAGFSLELVSAFRGFDHQLSIWNAKAQGLRPLYNDHGELLDYKTLSPREVLYAILRWSALPGASRHHWGTDVDVVDKSALYEAYKIQLTPEETKPDGIFGPFHLWLDSHLPQTDFYRPYAEDTGGIAPEKWHLSYAPLSHDFQKKLSFELIQSTIQNAEIELKNVILQELPEIYQRYIDI